MRLELHKTSTVGEMAMSSINQPCTRYSGTPQS